MKHFDKIVSRLNELSDPATLSAHIQNNTNALQETLPNVSQALASHIARSSQYLGSKIPKPISTFPLQEKWEPSEVQKQKFERHYDAVNNPTEILHHISKGDLTSEHMEALQSVHPELLQDMQHKLRSEIRPEVAAGLPNHVKRSLSTFMGTPLEPIDVPAMKLSNQATFQKLQQQKAAQAQMVRKSTQKGLSEIGLGKRAATETQKDEETQ